MKWEANGCLIGIKVKILRLDQQTEISVWPIKQSFSKNLTWSEMTTTSPLLTIHCHIFQRIQPLSWNIFWAQPGKKEDPTLLKSTATVFILRCQVICWLPGRFFYPVCRIENSAQCGRRRGSIGNTRPSHRYLHNFILLKSVSLPFLSRTHRASTLLTLSLQLTLANFHKQRWSNTSRRCTSCWWSGHVSHPYNKTERTAALYTRPFTGRETSFLRHRCIKLAKAIRALLIRALISELILPALLRQLPR